MNFCDRVLCLIYYITICTVFISVFDPTDVWIFFAYSCVKQEDLFAKYATKTKCCFHGILDWWQDVLSVVHVIIKNVLTHKNFLCVHAVHELKQCLKELTV